MSLKSQDPTRYARLTHPGDAFCYDIFSQVGALLRTRRETCWASCARNTSSPWVSHSRRCSSPPTSTPSIRSPGSTTASWCIPDSRPAAPLDGSSIFDESQTGAPQAVKFRPDLRVPLVTIITETDLFGGVPLGLLLRQAARQRAAAGLGDPRHRARRQLHDPGGADRHRLGAARRHRGGLRADQHADGSATRALHQLRAATSLRGAGGDRRALPMGRNRRARAQRAPPIEVRETEAPQPILDRNGLAQGGIRTPWVDVPTARTSGAGASADASESIMAAIFGSGEPFDAATVRRLYPGGPHRVPGTLHGRARHARSNPVSSCRPIAPRSSSSPPRHTPAASRGSPQLLGGLGAAGQLDELDRRAVGVVDEHHPHAADVDGRYAFHVAVARRRVGGRRRRRRR